jgi:Tfp pilus assembly protein PilN
MIKVNLAKRKTSSSDKASGSGGLSSLSDLFDSAILKEYPVVQMLSVVIAYFGAQYVLEYYKKLEMDKLEVQVQMVTTEKNNYEQELRKYSGLEEQKRKVEQTERLLDNKILAIKELVGSRTTSVRLISHVSQSLKDEEVLKNVWIVNFTLQGDKVKITGQAYDQNLVSVFMENIKKIPLLQSQTVTLDSLNQVKKLGEEVSEFVLGATRRVEVF